jgi:hypothetical protein
MLGNAKELKRNDGECKGILIGPSMAPHFSRRSDSVVVFFLTVLREGVSLGQISRYGWRADGPPSFPTTSFV